MALHSMYMKDGDGFALVFSLTSLESVNELQSIREQIHRIKEGRVRLSSLAFWRCESLTSTSGSPESAARLDRQQVRSGAGATSTSRGRDQHLKSMGRCAVLRDIRPEGDQHCARIRGPRATNDPGRRRRAAQEGEEGAEVQHLVAPTTVGSISPLFSSSTAHSTLHRSTPTVHTPVAVPLSTPYSLLPAVVYPSLRRTC